MGAVQGFLFILGLWFVLYYSEFYMFVCCVSAYDGFWLYFYYFLVWEQAAAEEQSLCSPFNSFPAEEEGLLHSKVLLR